MRTDDADYVRIANAILTTGAIPTHYFPIGYPLFVALCFSISGGSIAFVQASQIFLGMGTILCVWQISRRLWGETCALAAAMITAFYPPLVFMEGRVMSETLFITLLFLSLVFWVEWSRQRALRFVVLGSLAFGLACLVRSNLLLMAAAIPVWIGATTPDGRAKACWFGALAGGILAFTIVSPGAYFYMSGKGFTPFATNAGKTFWGANNELAKGDWISPELHPELVPALSSEVRQSEAERNHALYAAGFLWIRQNPGKWLALLPKKFANAWIPGLQTSEVVSRSRATSLILLLSYGPLAILGVVGAIFLRRRSSSEIPLILVLLTYTVMSLIFYGNPRIGLFCAPVLAIYAAAWITHSLHLGAEISVAEALGDAENFQTEAAVP